ncbi:MAG TPA: hypothetical protein VFQ65_07655 [Kofleriaceae bacterium]|nr:hypothetical protein [Kofleriaceae bacterium]
MTRLCLFAFLVACSHSDAPPPAEPTVAAVPATDPAPCPEVAAQAIKLMPGSDQMKPIIERHCVADLWSAALRKCMLLAKSEEELVPCHKEFAGTQRASLEHDLDALKTADSTPASAVPPAAPTPAAPDVPPAANTMPK